MRILVTNDDGIDAPGLTALVGALSDIAEVAVCAPEREQSCTGHAITLHKPLRMRRVALDGLEGEAYAVSGTPADCVVLARFEETAPPDLVVSGINAGANLGEEVFYSGTVAGAMEGCLQGLRSLAISVTEYERCDFRAAARFAARFAPVYASMDLPEGVMLNVNVPNVGPERIAGVRVTRLGRRAYENFVQKREDPRGRAYYWFGGTATESDSGEDTDIGATNAGCISITPIRFDVTDHASLDGVRRAVEGLTL